MELKKISGRVFVRISIDVSIARPSSGTLYVLASRIAPLDLPHLIHRPGVHYITTLQAYLRFSYLRYSLTSVLTC